VEQHSPVTISVELPPFFKFFHVDTFCHYLPSPEALGPRVATPPDTTLIDDDEEYEAEEILSIAIIAGNTSSWSHEKDTAEKPTNGSH